MANILKLETKVQVYETVNLDIPLPHFFNDKDGYSCKVVNNDHLITVDTATNFWGIKVLMVKYNLDRIAKGTPISEFEFEAAYQKAQMYVDLINRNEEPLKEDDENVQIDEMIANRKNDAA